MNLKYYKQQIKKEIIMRCRCCDCNLSDYESTLKSETTGEYLDTCLECLNEIPEVAYIDRPDLSKYFYGEEDEI